MTLEENKALVRRYFEDAPNNPAACDEIFASCVRWHALYHTANPDFESTPELEKAAYENHKKVWGSWIEHIDEMIAEGDRVMVRWSGRGTQDQEYFGLPPTHKPVALSGIYIFRIADDKIAEVWNLWDRLGEWQQLDVLPETKVLIAMAREAGKNATNKVLQSLLTMLAETKFSWFSSVRSDGRPHSVPVCHVLHQGRIYVATPSRSVKISNIRSNAHVTVAAYLKDPEAGLIVEGHATLKPELRLSLSPLFEKKYSWNLGEDERHDALVEVTPTKLIAWGSSGEGRWSGEEILQTAQIIDEQTKP
jgi:general stress protein 26